ncbi:MAG: ABC transporter ATP-binding protein [Bacteroidales bacterium]|nr:ABC transporter ATP-binding protein [Bacteroidales bacterium]
MDEPVIVVRDISKHYAINAYRKNDRSKHIKQRLEHFPIFKKKEKFKNLNVLGNINFTLNKGDVLGVVGPNGSGKSTLLKIITGITKPSAGDVLIRGHVVSVMELGVGFIQELSGRENVFHTAALFGEKSRLIAESYDAIEAFSGLEGFMDMPVKYYSSGMFARLAFSIVAHIEADIYLFDEVLAVGDSDFRRKALNKIKSLVDSHKTIILVSHNLNEIAEVCNLVMLLDKGKLRAYGSPLDVIDSLAQQYFNTGSEKGLDDGFSALSWKAPGFEKQGNILSLQHIEIKQEPQNQNQGLNNQFPVDIFFKGFIIDASFSFEVALTLTLQSGFPIVNTSHVIIPSEDKNNASFLWQVQIPTLFMNPMIYLLDVYVVAIKNDSSKLIYSLPKCLTLNVEGEANNSNLRRNIGVINADFLWKH